MALFILFLAEISLSLLVCPVHNPLQAQPYNLFRERIKVNRLGLTLRDPYFERKGILLYVEQDVELEPLLIVERTVADTTRYGALELEVFTVGGYLDHLVEEKTREMWRQTVKKSLGGEGKEAEDEGLLPDLELPMDLPKPLAKVIGRGGGLKVSGSNRVSLGGTTTFYDPEPPQEITRISKFPKLDLEQILRVKVEGTIGEKIHVFIDHDSEREFQEKNAIKVMYKGTEDEILQLVELGDTDVSLPGSRFVSGGMASKGLFGAKAEGGFGDLHFTMVATKQKGQTEKKSFQGYATQDSLLLRDTQFQENYHFSLVGKLDDFIAANYPNTTNYPAPGTIQIWIDDQDGSNNLSGDRIAIPGSAYIDPDNPDSVPGEAHTNGYFTLQQETVDYTVDPSNLIVDFTGAILENEVVAVSYVTNGGDTVGFVTADSVRLKLLKAPDYFATSVTWGYQLRNEYYLGSTDIVESSLQVFIYKGDDQDPLYDEELEGATETYLHIFGLDDNKDGLVDPTKIDFNRGVIIFPDFEPFAEPTKPPHGIGGETWDILEPNEAMYVDDNPQSTFLTNQIYTIKVKYRSLTSSFNLGVLNIIEGSDRVTVGGRPLTRGVDYDIIYDIGQIIFLNPDILAGGGEIDVDYEYAPLFAQTQTTLLGFRGDYAPSENASLATTWFMQSDRSIEQKPRLGDESRRSVIGEVDGQLKLEPSFLTDFANALPLVQTDEVSKVNVSGEVAVSIPNPNTLGEVFLDDFEGSELIDSYSVVRVLWAYGSIPPDTGQAFSLDQGGGIRWFNAPREWGITEGTLSPNVPAEEQGLLRTVLVVDFAPDTRDGTSVESSFRSITQPLSSSGLDMSQRKFLRMWILSDQGELWVDLGSVSEDALRYREDGNVVSPNNGLDSEDDPTIPDGRLDADEDIGLDRVEGVDGPGVTGDDGNDDFEFDETDPLATRFDRVNGTEGNNEFDTEDLNGNFSLDTSEKFFRLRLDLSDQDRFVVSRNDETGWRLLEIPLADSTVFEEFFDPDIRRIKHARLTFTNFSRQDTVMIGSLEISGNRWLEAGVETADPIANPVGPDEAVTVSVRNTRDNADYTSPPGVTPVRYENIPGALQKVKEQSVALISENLAPGHRGLVNQPLLSPQNYISYGEFSVWVHGGESQSEFLFRVGTDSTNFYELKNLLAPGWQEFRVPFKTMTDAKQEILATLGEDTPADSIDVVHANGIRVRGKPSLTNVRMLMLGVGNPEGAVAPLSGEVWIDELRLTSVNRNKGYARRITVDTKIADLASVKVDYENRDNQFMQLNQRITEFGFKSKTATSVAATLNLDSFTPASQGLSIPVSYSRTRSLELPRYKTGSDIILDPGVEQDRERTEGTSDTYGIRFSKKRPSQNLIVRATVDKLSYDASFSTRNSVNPTSRYWERNLNTGFGYNNALEGDYDLPIFPKKVFGFLSRLPLPDIVKETALVRGISTARLRYAPTQFSLGGRFNNLSNERVTGTTSTPYRLNTSTGTGEVSVRPLRSLTSKYHLEVMTDRTQPKQGSLLGLFSFNKGTEIQRSQSIDIDYAPEVLSWFSPTWGYNTTYRENHRPEVAGSLGDTTDVRKFDNTTRRNFSIDLDLPGIAAPLLKQRSPAEKDTTVAAGQSLFSKSMGVVLGTLKPVRFNVSREKFSDYQFVPFRPSFSYQIGLEDLSIDPWERRISRSLGVDTGLKFPQGVSVDGGYSETNTDRTSRSSASFSEQRTWPKVNVAVSGIKVPQEWTGVLTSVTARSGYIVRKDVAGSETNGVESTTRSVTYSPLVSLTMNLFSGLSTQVSLEKGRSEARALVGLKSTTVSTNSSQQVSLDYVFKTAKGFGIPLPGLSSKKIKFKSNMRTGLTFNRARTKRVNSPESGNEVVQSDNVTTSIKPSLSYDMTRMTAGFQFSYDVNDDKKQAKKRITVGASMWIEFIF
jgi:hypothetical protein